MSGDDLRHQVLSETLDLYREVMAVAAHNIGAMEREIGNIRQERLREQFDELINEQLSALELMRDAIVLLRKETDRDLAAFHALRMGALGMALSSYFYEAKRLLPQTNLKPFPKVVTDEQIRSIISDPRYPTRQEQADRLGIQKRSLERRIAKLNDHT